MEVEVVFFTLFFKGQPNQARKKMSLEIFYEKVTEELAR
jgi:hypothetical protein